MTVPTTTAPRHVVEVTAHGADPTGLRDSSAAVRDAIAAARRAGGPVTLRFAPGTYAFRASSAVRRELYVSNTVGADPRYREKAIGILLEGFDDIEIDGGGALFEYHGRQTTIAVIDCGRAELHDFAVDMVQPTVVEVTVRETGVAGGRPYRLVSVPPGTDVRPHGRTVTWRGETGPDGGEPAWTGEGALDYCQVLDPRVSRTRRTECPLFDHVERVTAAPGGLRIDYRADAPVPDDEGLVYQLRHTDRDHPGVFVLESGYARFHAVRFGYLHGFGLLAQSGGDLLVQSCVFATREGTGRTTAGFADFVQASGLSGRVVVEDCRFDGAHDDAINVHGLYLRVDRVDGDELELSYPHPETAGFPQFSAGERCEIVRVDDGTVVATDVEVLGVDGPSGRDHAHDLTRMRIRCAGPLPGAVTASAPGELAVENITRTPAVTVRRSTFLNLPTRGVLVSTRKPVLIEDCVFTGLGMAGVLITCEAGSYWESGPVADCTVRDNRFEELGGPAVQISPPHFPAGGRSVHRGIRVLGNHVSNCAPWPHEGDEDRWLGPEARHWIVDATSVDGLVVLDNTAASGSLSVRLDHCPGAEVGAGSGSPVRVSPAGAADGGDAAGPSAGVRGQNWS
ncbi:right-handed parallel beta-helix repeat-containing protein [Streptomyces sp. NPDC088261]|uniref:right-handed parallel beta-helix repeat-containing protein n=1 Tax=Streptomyces sp. NPDC088261 TaxID=3365851 RepID=UPI0038050340